MMRSILATLNATADGDLMALEDEVNQVINNTLNGSSPPSSTPVEGLPTTTLQRVSDRVPTVTQQSLTTTGNEEYRNAQKEKQSPPPHDHGYKNLLRRDEL